MYWSMILGVLRFDISYIVRKILGNDIYKINQNYINKTISHFITQQIIPIIKKHNNISIFYQLIFILNIVFEHAKDNASSSTCI